MTRKSSVRMVVIAIMMALTMVLTAAPAFAQGHGGGGGGGGGEEASNNLSVPAIFVGGQPFTNVATCDGTSFTPPSGDPLSGYPIDPAKFYYVQGIHTWQASCATATAATVTAAWGDNLIGEAKLKTNSPIRVEMGLLDAAPPTTMTGFEVVKLDPNALDRVSAYGTEAIPNGTGGFTANPLTPFTNSETGAVEVRVWVAGASLMITNPSGTTSTLDVTAEINATGRVVYGFNLRVTTGGTYTLHFTVPAGITVNSANGASDITVNTDGSTTISLPITVQASSGRGGGRGGGGGGGGGGGH